MHLTAYLQIESGRHETLFSVLIAYPLCIVELSNTCVQGRRSIKGGAFSSSTTVIIICHTGLLSKEDTLPVHGTTGSSNLNKGEI